MSRLSDHLVRRLLYGLLLHRTYNIEQSCCIVFVFLIFGFCLISPILQQNCISTLYNQDIEQNVFH